MASNSATVQAQQQSFQQPNSQHHCKECGLYFDSGKSLECHLQYHKENLLNKWASQATQSGHGADETNNNTTAKGTISAGIKRGEYGAIAAPADSSDAAKTSKSPTEAGGVFNHPPTPQSYVSAPSPYQNSDGTGFSPGFSSFQQVKVERSSPTTVQYSSGGYPHYVDNSHFFAMEAAQHNQNPYQQQEYHHPVQHKMPQAPTSFRYHPYHQQVSSSSPAAYPNQNPQPTPSPSPKQCDKCGFVCESAGQLIEHTNVAHPPTPSGQHLQQQQQFFHHQYEIKSERKAAEDEPQAEILDLDSHKVHQVVYPPNAAEEQTDPLKRQNGELTGNFPSNSTPYSVSSMLQSPWPNNQQKMFAQQPKLFQQQQQNVDYMSNGVTTTTQDHPSPGLIVPDILDAPGQPYRPQPSPAVISSTQLPGNPGSASTGPVIPSKGTNWKSNEARRPKTYNCSACNKWFTSSGHLKRHYNTTLHKNAVKSSGQPDPATLPISVHHHPARAQEMQQSQGGKGNSPQHDDDLSQPHQQHAPPPNGHFVASSPPNGDAGLSEHSRGLLSSSMPSAVSPPMSMYHHHHHTAGLAHPHPHSMGLQPAQMPYPQQTPTSYPNALAPHVMPVTMVTISNQAITGELTSAAEATEDGHYDQQTKNEEYTEQHLVLVKGEPVEELEQEASLEQQATTLPSFAAFHQQLQHQQRYQQLLAASGYECNVGGADPVTDPILYSQHQEQSQQQHCKYQSEEVIDPTSYQEAPMPLKQQHSNDTHSNGESSADEHHYTKLTIIEADEPFSPPNNNNNNNNDAKMILSDPLELPIKVHKISKFKEVVVVPSVANAKSDTENSSPHITSTKSDTPTSIHKCYDCDKLFNKACYLTQHNKTFHSGEKPFKCGRCGKRFSCSQTYEDHLAKHAGDKPYKCDQCPKQFNHKTDLRRHMCLHSGQKPYTCETCGKGFIRKDHMLKHCLTHTRKISRAPSVAVVAAMEG